jgi:hypothetical protein
MRQTALRVVLAQLALLGVLLIACGEEDGEGVTTDTRRSTTGAAETQTPQVTAPPVPTDVATSTPEAYAVLRIRDVVGDAPTCCSSSLVLSDTTFRHRSTLAGRRFEECSGTLPSEVLDELLLLMEEVSDERIGGDSDVFTVITQLDASGTVVDEFTYSGAFIQTAFDPVAQQTVVAYEAPQEVQRLVTLASGLGEYATQACTQQDLGPGWEF